jgi:hypothetical protein
MGEFCQQVTGNGTIEILRKTFEGDTEEFYVEGGQVIDENGVWAFQVPMNLDYMYTSEDGTMIPSNDPNKGVPTRTRVRFRIGMNETGDNGRLRTRAKYLVPNNPQSDAQIDYSFNETTKETSFRNMFWNKIYTVSNFISRYQRQGAGPRDRNSTGIKNVDNCVGDKTPFPYNKVHTDANPIFTVLCLLINIIGQIVWGLNNVILPPINLLFFVFEYMPLKRNSRR